MDLYATSSTPSSHIVSRRAESSASSSLKVWIMADSEQCAADPSAAQIAEEDARWDAITVRHADGLARLLAEVDDTIERGDSKPLDFNDF